MAKLMTVRASMFGDVTIEDGAFHLMDGGIHGVQGHTIVVPPMGRTVRWERRLDGVQPIGKPGGGSLELATDEETQVRGWTDGLWALAPKGKASFHNFAGPPRWVWALVVRRGNEVRMLEGGNVVWPDGAPEPARSALLWLIERVDGAAQ